MTFFIIIAFQTLVVIGVAVGWYQLGQRAGFARGENRGIHYALSAIRDVLEDDTDPRAEDPLMLAIDPGTTESAYVVYDLADGIKHHGKLPNAELLDILPTLGLGVPGPFVAIEMIASYGMAVGREVFETCLWVGRFIERLQPAPVRLIYRNEVKSYLCHSMKAKDGNIRAAIIDRFGPGKEKAIGKKSSKGPLYGISGDVWAALAVALTASETPPTDGSIRGG